MYSIDTYCIRTYVKATNANEFITQLNQSYCDKLNHVLCNSTEVKVASKNRLSTLHSRQLDYAKVLVRR